MHWFKYFLVFAFVALSPIAVADSGRSDFFVYSVYRGLDLGNGKEPPPKDYYVNMGYAQGLKEGAILEVLRRISSYDLMSSQLYRDVTVPIAYLKVIHVESKAAVARLDHMIPAEKSVVVNPSSIIVGDYVRLSLNFNPQK